MFLTFNTCAIIGQKISASKQKAMIIILYFTKNCIARHIDPALHICPRTYCANMPGYTAEAIC